MIRDDFVFSFNSQFVRANMEWTMNNITRKHSYLLKSCDGWAVCAT